MDPYRRQSDDGPPAPTSLEAVYGVIALVVISPILWFGWDAYLHSRMPIVEVRDERIVHAPGSFLGFTTPEETFVESRFARAEDGDTVVCRRPIKRSPMTQTLPGSPYRAYDTTGGCDGVETVSEYNLDWRITSLKAACLGYLVLALGVAFFIVS